MTDFGQAILFESPRLLFREVIEEDVESIFLLNEDPQVLLYTGDAPFDNHEAALDCIQNNIQFQYREYGLGRWAVIQKSDLAFLGWCGLKYRPERETIDLGYRFFKKYWGKGFATEASKACLQFGFEKLNLEKIIGTARIDNPASWKVLEKAGMIYDFEDDLEGFPAKWYTLTKEMWQNMLHGSKKSASNHDLD
ncbi:MAG: GNAT family N-acetyltransferase [Saprospiraceae bacterium]